MEPDYENFPALRLAFDALQKGGTAPAILNAANEVAVAAFLDEKIAFLDIAAIVSDTLRKVAPVSKYSLDDVLAADKNARQIALTLAAGKGA